MQQREFFAALIGMNAIPCQLYLLYIEAYVYTLHKHEFIDCVKKNLIYKYFKQSKCVWMSLILLWNSNSVF